MSDRFVSQPGQYGVTPPTSDSDPALGMRRLARAANPSRRQSGVESNPHEFEPADDSEGQERPECRVCGVPERSNPLHEEWIQQQEAAFRANRR